MESQAVELLRQNEIFEAMARPAFYPHPVTKVDQRETHASKVFLTGDYVYKVKKAVDLDFLNYTSLSKRKFFCTRETDLNRRLSRDIYLGVVPISRDGTGFSPDGRGEIVEYAVKMRQLPEQRSMLQLLKDGRVDGKMIEELAEKLADFYNSAATGGAINDYGSLETINTNCEENFQQMERFAGNLIDEQKYRRIRAATRSFLRRRKPLFKKRIQAGKIRDCHGDLRAGHIYFTDTIQIIDCIEFNERFRYSDITADLAFLVMDIEFEGKPQVAHRLFDCYVHKSGDPDSLILIDFYKCYRAVVRAKVNCFRLEDPGLDRTEREKLLRETDRYLELADRYVTVCTRPTLWVVCGMAASGKSTVAGILSEKLGSRVLHSDRIRKDIFGKGPGDNVDVPFGKGIYSKDASSLTYSKMLALAQEETIKGNSVILDATFSNRERRRDVLRLAGETDANIIFIECTSPENVIKSRLHKREGAITLSDARLHHFEQLRSSFEPLDELSGEIHIRIDTRLPVSENMMEILSHEYIEISIPNLQKFPS